MMTLPKCSIEMHTFLAHEESERKKKIAEEARKNNLSYLNKLLADICRAFGVDINIVKSGDSKAGTVMIRKIFYYIVKAKTNTGYKTMAKVAGRIDHSHCIGHVRKIKQYLNDKDPEFKILWGHYLENSKLYTKNDFT